jgi:hypothetical protein
MNRGQRLVQLVLLSSMCLLSVMGLVISLRLKAELEECLEKLRAMVVHANAADLMALGMSEWAPPDAYRSDGCFRSSTRSPRRSMRGSWCIGSSLAQRSVDMVSTEPAALQSVG